MSHHRINFSHMLTWNFYVIYISHYGGSGPVLFWCRWKPITLRYITHKGKLIFWTYYLNTLLLLLLFLVYERKWGFGFSRDILYFWINEGIAIICSYTIFVRSLRTFFLNFIILELLCYFFVCLLWIWNKIKSLLLLCVFDYYKNMDIEIIFFLQSWYMQYLAPKLSKIFKHWYHVMCCILLDVAEMYCCTFIYWNIN